MNVTVPVGVPAAAEVTVAVKVTICAKLEGFNEEASDVLVAAGVTGVIATRRGELPTGILGNTSVLVDISMTETSLEF